MTRVPQRACAATVRQRCAATPHARGAACRGAPVERGGGGRREDAARRGGQGPGALLGRGAPAPWAAARGGSLRCFALRTGFVGLPNVGKSTLFNAIVENGKAEAANFPFCTIEPNVGIVAVPDARLDSLAEISKSAKTLPTTVRARGCPVPAPSAAAAAAPRRARAPDRRPRRPRRWSTWTSRAS